LKTPTQNKIKSTSLLLLIILSATLLTMSQLQLAKAQTVITSLTPISGNVGMTALLQGNITTADGSYEIRWDQNDVVASGNATGVSVNATFTIPEAIQGDHSVTLFDLTTSENATDTLLVAAAYNLQPKKPVAPEQLQESDSVTLDLNITGSTSDASYHANVTVLTPNNVSYSQLFNLTTSTVGTAEITVHYPDDFTAVGAKTNFVGAYTVFFNTSLAVDGFTIGLTNSTEYHRSQTVDIKALYAASTNVNVTISGNALNSSEIVQADNTTGIVHYTNFALPTNATVGTYTVTVAPVNQTAKTPPDTQDFTIPGFATNVTTLNLAHEPVPNVELRVYENAASVTNGTSDGNGIVYMTLENGNYAGQAFFKDTFVGEAPFTVVGETEIDFTCNLTNIKVTVTDEAQNYLPAVALFLTPDNTTLTTDINGTATAHSLLPNASYAINASRYDTVFNTTAIASLPATNWYNITIIVPTITLQTSITDANEQPIANAIVKAQDLLGGQYYNGTTNVQGTATLNAPLGMYDVTVYVNDIRLNETTVNLNTTGLNIPIDCTLYGLTVTVSIIDYFGQPITNANVTLQGNGIQNSALVSPDGKAVFNNVVGGNLQVTVRLASQSDPYIVTTASVDKSTAIKIRIERYIMLAGALIDAGQFAAIVLIIVVLLILISAEVIRRLRRKQPKNENKTENTEQ
jgi:hypothetical protein